MKHKPGDLAFGRVVGLDPIDPVSLSREVATGVLMAVEVQGLLRTRLRVPNHHQVVIGVQSYDDGRLVISLEPSY